MQESSGDIFILKNKVQIIFFVFVCLGFFVPLEIFSLIWRRRHYRWRAADFDMCPELMAIEQWGIFKRATPTMTRGIRL